MDCWRNYIDISSCMLLEATGDSEVDSGLANMGKVTPCSTAADADRDVEDIRMHFTASLAEDDALSCSCCDNLCSDDFDGASSVRDYGNDEAECAYQDDEQPRLRFMDGHGHDRHGPPAAYYPDFDEDEDRDVVDQVRAAGAGENNVIKKRINNQRVEPPGAGAVEVIMNMMEFVEAGRPKESKVCRKPELISQRDGDRDRDRLFWEACLSS